MRDKSIRAVYLTLSESLTVEASEISIEELFNTDRPNDQLRFDFETRFEPYQQYALGDIGVIDLVVKNDSDGTDAAWLPSA